MGRKTASLAPTKENARAESMPVLPSEVDVLQRKNFCLGVVTVVLLFAYTTVATFQWRAMLKANKNAAEALQTTERPYVALGDRDGRIGDFVKTDSGIPVALKLYFFNSGHEPATDVTIDVFAFGPAFSQFTPQHIERWKMVGPSFQALNPPRGGAGSQGITIPGESTYTLYRSGKWIRIRRLFNSSISGLQSGTSNPKG